MKLLWCCDQRAKGCKARLHTDAATNRIVRRMDNHTEVVWPLFNRTLSGQQSSEELKQQLRLVLSNR